MKTQFTEYTKQLDFGITAAAIGAGAALLGQAGQMQATKLNNTKNYKRTQKLMEKQDAMNRSMALFNQENQLNLWKATGPVGQVEQLKAAGLNPALIYDNGGTGGSTAAAPAQGPSQGGFHGDNPGAGLGATGLGIAQMAMMKAQIDNLNSQTNKNNVEAEKTGGVDTEKTGQEILNLKQGVQNLKAQERLTDIEGDIKEVELEIKNATAEQSIALASQQNQVMEQQIRSMVRNNYIDQATAQTKIKQAGANLAQTWAQNTLIKENTNVAVAEQAKIKQEISNMMRGMELNWRALETNQSKVAAEIKALNNQVQMNDTPASIRAIQDFGKTLTGMGILSMGNAAAGPKAVITNNHETINY